MAFTMTIMPGLPPYGEPAIGVGSRGVGQKIHSEHLVVKFAPDGAPSWMGNFVRGMGNCTLVRLHPNGRDALIISRGEAYIIDPYSQKLIDTFGGGIDDLFEFPPLNALILNHYGRYFEAIGPSGQLWESRDFALDGIRNGHIHDHFFSGEAWDVDDNWYPFQVDLNTGEVIGELTSKTSYDPQKL